MKTTMGAAASTARVSQRLRGETGPTMTSIGVVGPSACGRRIAQPDHMTASDRPATADTGIAHASLNEIVGSTVLTSNSRMAIPIAGTVKPYSQSVRRRASPAIVASTLTSTYD